MTANGYKVFLWGDENVQKLDYGDNRIQPLNS